MAAETKGPYRSTLLRLSGWLSAGSSISAALARTPNALSEDETLAIQCAIENDRVDGTFEILLERASEEPPADRPTYSSTIIYLALSSAVLLWVLGLMTFIVPTFEQMFQEFGIALPASMSMLTSFMSRFGSLSFLIVLCILAIGIAFQFGEVRQLFKIGFWKHISPNTPALRSAGILRLLAVPTKNNESIASTLTAAAQFHPESSVRTRLMRVRAMAEDDQTLFTELARQGLIRAREAKELPKIETPSLRAWAMLSLAERKAQLVAGRNRVAANFARHLPVLVLAVFVGWIAVAFIQSLTSLVLPLA